MLFLGRGMKNKKFQLLPIKHDINSIFFKIETAVELISNESLPENEKREVVSILKNNLNLLKLVLSNLFLMERLKDLKKERIYLKDFFKENVSVKYVYGYPTVVSQAIQNLKELKIDYSLYEKEDKIFIKIKGNLQDRFSKYILDITKFLFEINNIYLEE